MWKTISAIYNSLKGIYPFMRYALPPVWIVSTVWAFSSGLWARLLAGISGIPSTGGFTGLDAVHYLNLANYFLPLDEGLTMLGSYVALLLACAVVRIVKSFIPTIAS